MRVVRCHALGAAGAFRWVRRSARYAVSSEVLPARRIRPGKWKGLHGRLRSGSIRLHVSCFWRSSRTTSAAMGSGLVSRGWLK